ncbi:MAG: hypothetical protein GY861_17505 [bacterium]|nr:hypothetical protein [bacterium]
MIEKKTIGTHALSLIIGALVMLGGVNLTDDDVHYCEDRALVMQCDKLTKYYGLDNGKCWNDAGNKLCRSGWLLVEDDYIQSEKEQNYTSAQGDFLCSPLPEGCKPIKE